MCVQWVMRNQRQENTLHDELYEDWKRKSGSIVYAKSCVIVGRWKCRISSLLLLNRGKTDAECCVETSGGDVDMSFNFPEDISTFEMIELVSWSCITILKRDLGISSLADETFRETLSALKHNHFWWWQVEGENKLFKLWNTFWRSVGLGFQISIKVIWLKTVLTLNFIEKRLY